MENTSVIFSTKEVSIDIEKMREFVESLQIKRPLEKQDPCTEDDL